MIQSSKLSKKEVKEMIRFIYNEKYFSVNGIDEKVLCNCLEEMGLDHKVFL
jgi:predicted DsbA family dithiol-disulfide isomerase